MYHNWHHDGFWIQFSFFISFNSLKKRTFIATGVRFAPITGWNWLLGSRKKTFSCPSFPFSVTRCPLTTFPFLRSLSKSGSGGKENDVPGVCILLLIWLLCGWWLSAAPLLRTSKKTSSRSEPSGEPSDSSDPSETDLNRLLCGIWFWLCVAWILFKESWSLKSCWKGDWFWGFTFDQHRQKEQKCLSALTLTDEILELEEERSQAH